MFEVSSRPVWLCGGSSGVSESFLRVLFGTWRSSGWKDLSPEKARLPVEQARQVWEPYPRLSGSMVEAWRFEEPQDPLRSVFHLDQS